jgi:hypothetical protein
MLYVRCEDGTSGFVDRWSAGGLVVISLLRLLIDGDESKLVNALDKVHPSDMIQTEHHLIVKALKSIRASGQPITMESLLQSFDYLGEGIVFVLVVLDRAVENCKSFKFSEGQVDAVIDFVHKRRRA